MILIPVSIEKNLSSTKEAILLGNWCKNIYTTNIPQENIVSYHWEDKNKLIKDSKYIDDLYERLLPAYSGALNRYHNSSHSEMFWRLSCGNWLQSFITASFDRWNMMKFALESFNIKEIAVLNLEGDLMVPKNLQDYTNLCLKSDEWNSYIFYEISKELSDVKITEFQIYNSKNLKRSINDILKNCTLSLKRKALYLLEKILNLVSIKNNIVFVDSYLPIFEQWKIERKLRQFPSLLKFDEPIISTYTNKSREGVTISYETKNDFESFLVSLIPNQIPVSYLEDFNLIVSKFNKFPSYSSVKVIFTANAHLLKDQFNIWSAHAKENGAQLVIGQHGGGTRCLKIDQNLNHEYAICDYYIAWGKGGKFNNKNVVLPVNKYSEYLPNKNLKKKGLLHVLDHNYRYIQYVFSNEVTSSFMDYLISQKIFSNLINNKSVKEYKLRPNNNISNAGWYKDCFIAESNFIDTEKHFIKSIKNNRLILISVNQTTLLQSLAMNIPTVGFWNSEILLLNESAFNDYKKLYDVGILYDSPEAAAKHINEQWENIEEWWNSSQLQTVRKEFCDKYVYTSTDSDRVKEWTIFFNRLIEN